MFMKWRNQIEIPTPKTEVSLLGVDIEFMLHFDDHLIM